MHMHKAVLLPEHLRELEIAILTRLLLRRVLLRAARLDCERGCDGVTWPTQSQQNSHLARLEDRDRENRVGGPVCDKAGSFLYDGSYFVLAFRCASIFPVCCRGVFRNMQFKIMPEVPS